MNYGEHFQTHTTPQTKPIPGSAQVPNSAGGFSFQVDDWTRLDRFLLLGTEGGSYYATEQKLTVENAEAVQRCIAADGLRTVARIVEISEAGRAPKNDPAIFALAMCLKLGAPDTRRAARDAVSKVCRIGTHIFQLSEAVKAFGGWGRNTKAAVASWYTSQTPDRLAHQMIKYQNRNGWSHLDLIRKAHPESKAHEALFRWLARAGDLSARTVTRTRETSMRDATDLLHDTRKKKYATIRTDHYDVVDILPEIIGPFEEMRRTEDPGVAARLIIEHNLPREVVPTELLKSTVVWDALLHAGRGMPLTAMIRNLGKMSSIGLLAPLSSAEAFVCQQLGNQEALSGARVHPLAILLAQSVYGSGQGIRGSLSWTVSSRIVDALNDAFYQTFKNIEPTGKRWFLGVDVSGSMDGGSVAGTHLTPREAAGALALVTARVESQYFIEGFSHQLVPLAITPKTRLDQAVSIMRGVEMGGTDCALPITEALRRRIPVDVFAVYTDSETWAGHTHPVQALKEYRDKMGIPARLIVVGLTSNGFTIADPNDSGMLDMVGLDSAGPQIMADFARA